jgi:hypothetical protein
LHIYPEPEKICPFTPSLLQRPSLHLITARRVCRCAMQPCYSHLVAFWRFGSVMAKASALNEVAPRSSLAATNRCQTAEICCFWTPTPESRQCPVNCAGSPVVATCISAQACQSSEIDPVTRVVPLTCQFIYLLHSPVATKNYAARFETQCSCGSRDSLR